VLLAYKQNLPKQDVHQPCFSSQAKKEGPKHKQERKSSLENKDGLTKARVNTLRKDGTRAHKREAQILPQIKSSFVYKGLMHLWSNSLQGGEDDEILTNQGWRHMLKKTKHVKKASSLILHPFHLYLLF